MPVIIPMTLAVLIWSLYPLAAAIGLRQMTSLEMILIVYCISSIGAVILAAVYLWQRKLFSKAIQIQKSLNKDAYITIAISGLCGALCHGFFIISLTLADKGGVSLLYESWPVIAVVATPFLMQKTWKEVSFKEFLTSIIAMGGVAIIILSDNAVNWQKSNNNMIDDGMSLSTIGGYILAFAGGYMLAILVVTKGRYCEYFGEMKDDIGACLISEVISRIISLFLISIAFIFLQQKLDIASIHWGATTFLGLVVFVIGGGLYTLSLLKTVRPTIHILNYFVPILAVIWLYFAGETSLSWGLVIGGLVVVACNIYLFLASKKAEFSKPLV